MSRGKAVALLNPTPAPKHLRSVIEQNPLGCPTSCRLGYAMSLQLQGYTVRAMAAFERMLELSPGCVEAKGSLAILKLGAAGLNPNSKHRVEVSEATAALWDSFWHMPDGLEVAAAAARLAFWKHVDDQEGQVSTSHQRTHGLSTSLARGAPRPRPPRNPQNFAQTLALGVTRKQTGLTQPAEGVGLPSVASSQALLGSISQIRGEIETVSQPWPPRIAVRDNEVTPPPHTRTRRQRVTMGRARYRAAHRARAVSGKLNPASSPRRAPTR